MEAPLTLDRTAHLVVVATGAPAALRVCEEEWNEGSLSVWKGLSITDSVSGSPARRAAPRAATLVVDGAVLTPLASVSRPALEHSRGGWHAGDRQLRYYYDFRALAPRPDGAAHRVQLVFWPEGGALVETLPETAARSLGDQYVAWRLQDARDSVTAPLAYAPRRAVGGPVGDAMAEAARGRTPRAAVQLAEWMVAGASSRDFAPESRVAKLLLADILLQHGDSLVARAYVADARHDQPCLGAPAGASGGLRRIVDSFRAPAECDELSPRRALMNGLMLPGLGHAVNGSRWLAAGAGSLVAGVLASAVMLQSQGNARYAEYQAATSFSSAPRLYAEATDLRAQARSRAAFGIVLWAADAALSAFEAQFRNREVRDAQQ